ncbi:hypothetical protein pdam_00021724 [Pocillopora damicornis]|uniref:Dynamin N-terminal domain-containing protein n=1 Tax=Pocillopora damicornis TaxID=46731 RepID=A0A3M6UQY7_POCDA|nr:hypothetical protein pdam_00021724 [Pocillopora damicornis]
MMSTGLEKVDTIDDIQEACELVKSFGLSTKGLDSLSEVKNKLREHLKGLEETSSRKIGETHEVISNAGKSDADKRRKLLDLYKRTEQFMGQFEAEFLEILEKSFEDLNKSLQERKQNVEPSDQYVVLVAGETSAGKSSVINLILGEDLLPSRTLSTTSTICELKYGEKPMVGVHYKPNGTKTPEPAFHELNDGSKTYKEQIEKFVYVKEDREKTPYEKIELFFPHPLFKENVMIVDSPGVGESDVMSSFVLNYLPRAFCFMYVLCTSNAGGIQPDRLGKLLTCAQDLRKSANLDLSLSAACTLFVCNKWDLVEDNEREEVKRDTVKRLTRILGNFNPKSQIVYLSCKTAQWLEDLLDRMSRQVCIKLKSAKMSHQETEEKIKRVLRRMEELQNSQKRIFDELNRLLPFISKQLEDAVLYLRLIKEKILKLREGDELIYQRLLEDERGSTEIRKIYEPLNNELEFLRRNVTVYTLREIGQSDFAREELKCDVENLDFFIGGGSFSAVFRGILHRKGSPEIMVAIKMYSDPLTSNNVWHFVDEERALRQKLNEADDIAEVIDSMQNLSIPI